MVEPVSYSAGKTRTQRPNSEAGQTVGKASSGGVASTSSAAVGLTPGAAVASAAGMADSISFSPAARALPSDLKAGPPIDMESVSRIRDAIAENKYPIDLQAITESLFQSFLEISR
jgi:negative regulator of flagellin synthesis FlgM